MRRTVCPRHSAGPARQRRHARYRLLVRTVSRTDVTTRCEAAAGCRKPKRIMASGRLWKKSLVIAPSSNSRNSDQVNMLSRNSRNDRLPAIPCCVRIRWRNVLHRTPLRRDRARSRGSRCAGRTQLRLPAQPRAWLYRRQRLSISCPCVLHHPPFGFWRNDRRNAPAHNRRDAGVCQQRAAAIRGRRTGCPNGIAFDGDTCLTLARAVWIACLRVECEHVRRHFVVVFARRFYLNQIAA